MKINYPIRTQSRWLLPAVFTILAGFQHSFGAITFVPGDYYSANYWSPTITQYNPSGGVIGSFNVPSSLSSDVRGLAFGPDGLLYASAVQGSGFAVLAIDSSGTVQQTYAMSSVYLAGNLSYGKIAVNGQYIYVAGANQVTRFNVGDPNSGTSIYQNNQLFDVNILPNGNLLAASAYYIDEITSSGSTVRSIPGYFVDIRGIAYNPTSNDLFVTELGYTGFSFQLMRLDATSGAVEASTGFWYGDDLYLTDTGQLLVGSRTQAAGIFTQNLVQTGTLGSSSQMFVTECVVPEPSACALLITSAVALLAISKGRSKLLISLMAWAAR
jgi:hypothetical protein